MVDQVEQIYSTPGTARNAFLDEKAGAKRCLVERLSARKNLNCSGNLTYSFFITVVVLFCRAIFFQRHYSRSATASEANVECFVQKALKHGLHSGIVL
jgi:hypothetical protein